MRNWDPSVGREARRRELRALLNRMGGSMPLTAFKAYLQGRGYVVQPLMATLPRLGLRVEGDMVLLEETVGGGAYPGQAARSPPPPQTGELVPIPDMSEAAWLGPFDVYEESRIKDLLRLAQLDLGVVQPQPRDLSPEEEALVGEILAVAGHDVEMIRNGW